ncbi:hypothetical protein [Oscillibacter sp.]|uniref:hypothetical protein n=1 Tax=Oscillibacter sp. TaxID=1945593 RepID=UPI0026130365|nr:hypothetical protein [Oscillibacter sp.]MDD3346742.1 hypothetical protein [Oscillibacter sp.]
MKKFVFGFLVALIGLVFSAFGFIYAIMHPGTYNNIGGLLGSLLCADLLTPFIVSMAVMIAGLAICAYEAYRGN